MEYYQIELIIFSISFSIALMCMIVGLLRGLTSARTLGGGVMTMVMTWLIFIAILMLAYNLIYLFGLPSKSDILKLVAIIILLLVPICVIRIIWGFADYVNELKKLSQD